MTVRVQQDDFNIEAEIEALKADRTDIGAIVTFTGTVRDMSKTGPIKEMSLEHYPGMTEKQLKAIEQDAHNRWPLQGTTIIHRYGDLNPGDNIVLTITLPKHRQAAFEAAEFIMDFLKTKAPFWKKETPLEGEAKWVDARDCDEDALRKWEKEGNPKKDFSE